MLCYNNEDRRYSWPYIADFYKIKALEMKKERKRGREGGRGVD